MSDARAEIFARLNGTLMAGGTLEQRRAAVAARLADPPRVAPPARVQHVDLVETFQARAHEVGATTERIAGIAGLGIAVADYLRARNLAPTVKAAPELARWSIDWPATVEADYGGAKAEDTAGVAMARAGVAETGTVVLASGAASPTKLNFLPETHIVVVAAAWIVGTYEEAMDRVRAHNQRRAILPRTINWITGPSRTADIEQTILTGVHGPKRIHIIVVDDEP
jgi:L-lactate dehydrogenase complex protein LldG